jgi:tripartite-type tricarboxylate transporter receptor subunit TctC
MNYLSRRRFLHLAAGAVTLTATSRGARAQAHPNRPVRVLVGYPAGGATDTVARLVGQWLSDRLGRPFLVENRAGAASNIATEAVAHARADGYTLLVCTGANTINDSLYQRLNFNFKRDLEPIAPIVNSPLVYIHHFRQRLFLNSLPMPNLIQPKSLWHRAGAARRCMWLESCSR